ncbi:hypothetical protein BsWGS_06429 [Bradybaena similaris]
MQGSHYTVVSGVFWPSTCSVGSSLGVIMMIVKVSCTPSGHSNQPLPFLAIPDISGNVTFSSLPLFSEWADNGYTIIKIHRRLFSKWQAHILNLLPCPGPWLQRCEQDSQFQYTGFKTRDILQGFKKNLV